MNWNEDQASTLRKCAGQLKEPGNGRQPFMGIAVASGKGGVGKTFISTNLAITFHRLSKRVLLIDGDFGLANADILLNVRPRYYLQDFVFGRVPLEEVITTTSYGIDLLGASSGAPEMLGLGEPRLVQLMEMLVGIAGSYDVVMLDCAAGIDQTVLSQVEAMPNCLLVMTPHPTSLVDAYALVKLMDLEKREDRLGVVVNMAPNEEGAHGGFERLDRVVQGHLGRALRFSGWVPDSPAVARSIQARSPLVVDQPDHYISQCLRGIARGMMSRQSEVSRLKDFAPWALFEGLMGGVDCQEGAGHV